MLLVRIFGAATVVSAVAVAGILLVRGRVPVEPPEFAEHGPYEHGKIMAYVRYLRATPESDLVQGSDALRRAATMWSEAYENGELRPVAPLGIGVEEGTGMVAQLNNRLTQLQWALRASCRDAERDQDWVQVAEWAELGLRTARINRESTFGMMRRSMQTETALARSVERAYTHLDARSRARVRALLAQAASDAPDPGALIRMSRARAAQLALASGAEAPDPVASRFYAMLSEACDTLDASRIDQIAQRLSGRPSDAGAMLLAASQAKAAIRELDEWSASVRWLAAQSMTMRPSSSS